MKNYFSIAMFKEEFKKVKWFSPLLFLVLFIIFNNGEMLSTIKLSDSSGFSASYGIKNFISLSWVQSLKLIFIYIIGCTILMNNKIKYLRSEDFKDDKRISYLITEGVFLITAITISFIGNFLIKLAAYGINKRIFYDTAHIGVSYLLKFLIFHLILIILMVSISLFLNSLFGKKISVIIMPILVIYSYFLIFGTGYYLINESHIKTRSFIKWVEEATIYKVFNMINSDFRFALQDNKMQMSIMLFMLCGAVLIFLLSLISYRYMKPERLDRYFMYVGVEAVVMGIIFFTCSLYLSLFTALIMILRSENADIIWAWKYSYRFIFIYTGLAAAVRLTYVFIANRYWEVLMESKLKKRNQDNNLNI